MKQRAGWSSLHVEAEWTYLTAGRIALSVIWPMGQRFHSRKDQVEASVPVPVHPNKSIHFETSLLLGVMALACDPSTQEDEGFRIVLSYIVNMKPSCGVCMCIHTYIHIGSLVSKQNKQRG